MLLPYNPAMALKESYAGIYKIYILKHPATSEIFYVGQTIIAEYDSLQRYQSNKQLK